MFAGKDASRALATFSMSEDAFRNEYDDLLDLSSMQMESVREWEMQFQGKKIKNFFPRATLRHFVLFCLHINKNGSMADKHM